MSTVIEEIREVEKKALEEIDKEKEKVEDLKISALKKANSIIENGKKDTDRSFEEKLSVFEKKLSKDFDLESEKVDKELEKMNANRDDLVKKGVDFLYNKLFS